MGMVLGRVYTQAVTLIVPGYRIASYHDDHCITFLHGKRFQQLKKKGEGH
jgi:hypothetical protein